MEKHKLQELLSIAQKNEFCIKDEKNNYLPIQPNSKGEVVDVVSLIAKEVFGTWPLSEEQEKQFKILTNLKFRPAPRKALEKIA